MDLDTTLSHLSLRNGTNGECENAFSPPKCKPTTTKDRKLQALLVGTLRDSALQKARKQAWQSRRRQQVKARTILGLWPTFEHAGSTIAARLRLTQIPPSQESRGARSSAW